MCTEGQANTHGFGPGSESEATAQVPIANNFERSSDDGRTQCNPQGGRREAASPLEGKPDPRPSGRLSAEGQQHKFNEAAVSLQKVINDTDGRCPDGHKLRIREAAMLWQCPQLCSTCGQSLAGAGLVCTCLTGKKCGFGLCPECLLEGLVSSNIP